MCPGAFGACADDEPPGRQAGELHDREDEKQKVHQQLPVPPKPGPAAAGLSTTDDQFVNRRILTFRMRPNAASVAIIDEPP